MPAARGAARLPAGFTASYVTRGLSGPTSMALAPDGRIFVCEQSGSLRVVKDGKLLGQPFLHVETDPFGERGLLGVALDPGFPEQPYVYVYYTSPTPSVHNRVSRFTADGDQAVPGSEEVLFDLDPLSTASNHNGGALHFGPDGKLYVAVGDNARGAPAQSPNTLWGKVLRVNPDGSIPEDNPFFAQNTGKARAVWAYGLRNPFTFAFQPGTGRMFINDVGQFSWEEIDLGVAGSNYGWPESEGPTSDSRFRAPLFSYPHRGAEGTSGCAITGGDFYNPATRRFPPAYAGKYFFADLCNGWIRVFDPATRKASQFASGLSFPVDLDVSPDGALYCLARGENAILRIAYTRGQPPRITEAPQDVRVAVGQKAVFHVSVAGTGPFTYRWQRNGKNLPGATSPRYSIARTRPQDDGARFRCVVSNRFGRIATRAALLTVLSDRPPQAVISLPAPGTRYRAGQTLSYTCSGTDPEDGELPASAMTWRVDFHHDEHVHPYIPDQTGSASGEILIPDTGETAAHVWYRCHLTVRDSEGLEDSTYVDVLPETARITLRTQPAGLKLKLDGQPLVAPQTVEGVIGMQRLLGAQATQVRSGVTYVFDQWSDGGERVHTIGFPERDSTYTAVFRAQ